MLSSVAHIGLTVSNLERAVAFYRDILDLTYVGEMAMGGEETAQLFQRPGCTARVAYLRTEDPTAPLVELIQFTDQEAKQGSPSLFQTSISELCFQVEDIDKEYERLQSLGVTFLSEPQTFDSTAYGFGKSRAVYFYDEDRNILELIEPVQ